MPPGQALHLPATVDLHPQEAEMDQYEAWLSQMPVQGVRQRIAQLEQELAFLRQLEWLREQTTRSVSPTDTPSSLPVDQTSTPDTPPSNDRRRRLSPERKAIIEVIRQQPAGMSPFDVAQLLGRSDANAVQTNMSRMARAGQLLRVEQGRYRLPPNVPAASLLDAGAGEDEEEVGEP